MIKLRQKQENFDSLRANLYLAAKPSNLRGGRQAERNGEGEQRGGGEKPGEKHGVGALGHGAQLASVVVLVLVLLLVLLWVLLVVLLVLTEVEVLVGGDSHPDDQEHHLAKTQLLILVGVEVLEDLVDGDLVFHMLQERSWGEDKVPLVTTQRSPQSCWHPPGVSNSPAQCLAPSLCHQGLLWVQQ